MCKNKITLVTMLRLIATTLYTEQYSQNSEYSVIYGQVF